jgi:adenosylcobinamide-phosphate synthase
MPDTISLALIAGFVLDLLLGDPRWLPHPVRLIGHLANWAEPRCRRIIANEYVAGALFTMVVVAVAAGGVWIVIWGLQQLHPVLAALVMYYFVYAGRPRYGSYCEAGTSAPHAANYLVLSGATPNT